MRSAGAGLLASADSNVIRELKWRGPMSYGLALRRRVLPGGLVNFDVEMPLRDQSVSHSLNTILLAAVHQ